MHRADVVVAEFRARVRSDLRTHTARGGEVSAALVDRLEASLEEAAREITRALRG